MLPVVSSYFSSYHISLIAPRFGRERLRLLRSVVAHTDRISRVLSVTHTTHRRLSSIPDALGMFFYALKLLGCNVVATGPKTGSLALVGHACKLEKDGAWPRLISICASTLRVPAILQKRNLRILMGAQSPLD